MPYRAVPPIAKPSPTATDGTTPVLREEPTREQLLALGATIPGVLYQFALAADGRWCFLYLSDGIEALYEVSAAEAYADPDALSSCILEEDRAGQRESILHAVTTRSAWRHDYRIRTRSGSVKWVRGDSLPELKDDGSVIWNGILIDVSERHRLLESLADSEAFNATILNSLSEHIAVLDENGVIVAVNEAWKRFALENGGSEAVAASIGLNYCQVCNKASGQPKGDEAIAARVGILGVIAGHLPEFSLEYPCDSPTQQRWFSMRVYPLAPPRRGAVVAHLDITRSKLAEEALRESEHNLRLAQASARMGDFRVDLQSGRWQSSPGVDAILGIGTQFDYTIENWRLLLHPDHRQQAVDRYRQAVGEARHVSLECALARSVNGELRWIAAEGDVECDGDGRPQRLVGTVQDISERKRAEATQLRTIFDAAPTGMLLVSEDGHVRLANAVAARMFDYPLAELLGIDINCLTPARGAHRRHIAEFWHGGKASTNGPNRELVARRRDGSDFPVEINLSPITLDGARAVITSISDISARKRDEALLRSSEERLELAIRAGGIGIWEWRIDEDCLIWDDAMFDLYGIRREDFSGKLESWKKTIHYDDLERTTREFLDARNGKTEFDSEFRIRQLDGTVRYIKAAARLMVDETGHPQSLLGANWDVTEEKHVAEELQLAATVYEAIGEAILVADASDTVIAVNPAFTRLTGFSAEEAIGQKTSLLKSGRHDAGFYRAMWQALEKHGHWEGEIWNRRKNGEIYPEWLMISTVRNSDGKVRCRVAMFSDITEQKRAEQAIWQEANFDPLTGLPNRRMLRDRLDQELKKAHRARLPLAVLFLDLDHFKEVNDTLGHGMGDLLLCEAARRISQCVREADTVSRFGGDEFTILLGELEDRSSIDRIAQDILQRVAKPFLLQEEKAYVSASIGVTIYPDDADSIDELLKNADQAMYAAKQSGRNRFSYFTPAMQERALKRMHLLRDLRTALAGDEFRIHYQPIVNMASGRIDKAEALIRWQHPRRGLVSPSEFIPLAEESGLISEIGEWVFRSAARQLADWRKRVHATLQISINKSPVQFRNKDINLDTWFGLLAELDLPGGSLVVEITEGLLMEASPLIRKKLLAFRDAGVQVSLDDFGTGYSSLSYLKKFDIDYVKIDQSFVRNLAPDSDDLALCEAIIVMAHKLGIEVIAEGVETAAQRDLLASAGCDYGQGFLFAKALSADDFERCLIDSRTTAD
ncbi:hypothetical protein CKO20_11615 [Rhodocyclus tenuis]|nr:hypothetical protein [Rhodocyclus tenuis]